VIALLVLRRALMTKALIIAAAFAVAACSRGETYESGGTVDTVVNNRDSTRGLNIDFGTTRDTLNMPIIGTEKDTIIVNKPVVKGRRPVEVKRPTVDVNKKP
jgi:hypothetical protein